MAEPRLSVRDNPDEHRYEVFLDDDRAGFAVYQDRPGQRVFTHTKIDPDYEGHGVGSGLARAALDDVRSKGWTVVPRCPFIAGYIKRHSEYADLVAE